MKWFVSSKNIDEVVEAADRWEAFDTLRDRPAEDFGLIVEVQPVRETQEEAVAIRTSALFGKRWGRPEIAERFIAAAVAQGLGDTTEVDL